MAAPRSTLVISAPKRQGRFFYLFLSQVLLIVLFPYLAKPGLATVGFRLLGAFAFLSAVYAVSEKRAQWTIALVLAVIAGVLNVRSTLHPEPRIAIPSLLCAILFLGFTLAILLRAVLRSQIVTRDTIYGALSVYLLMAFLWGVAYLLLETIHPGAIAMDSARHPNHTADWFDCMFYSFVTLTSTGYGDMVPISPPARSLSILEAVGGIMYVAVLVARLVGLYAAKKVEPQSEL